MNFEFKFKYGHTISILFKFKLKFDKIQIKIGSIKIANCKTCERGKYIAIKARGLLLI